MLLRDYDQNFFSSNGDGSHTKYYWTCSSMMQTSGM